MDVTPKQGTQITKLEKEAGKRGDLSSGEWVFKDMDGRHLYLVLTLSINLNENVRRKHNGCASPTTNLG